METDKWTLDKQCKQTERLIFRKQGQTVHRSEVNEKDCKRQSDKNAIRYTDAQTER